MARYLYVTSLFFFVCISLGNIAYSDTIPGNDAAPESISMSWRHFMTLWEKYKEPAINRKKNFAYESAGYTGRASVDKHNYYLKFDAVIRITSFTDRKILVPILSPSLSPESMVVDGESAGWIENNGFYAVILNKKGSHKILTRFTITLDARLWPRKFHLPLVPVPKSKISLLVADKDIEARFDPGVVVETISSKDESTGDRIQGVIPSVSHVGIRWLKRSEKREMIPLKMGAVMHTYVALGENGADLKSEIAFQILQGETHYFKILVPKSIDILDVTALDGAEKISQWYAEDYDNSHVIHIYASYKQSEGFRIRLDCERTETRTNYQFEIPHIIPQDVERYENLIAVGSEANVEIEELTFDHAEGRDVRFLPDEIRRLAGARALFYYKTLEENFDIKFGVISHEKANVVKMRIERLEADSVVTEAGTVMTKATFRIKNNQAQFLRLNLPPHSKLLSAFTNGREIQPALSGNTCLLPVDKSTEKEFSVEIAWISKDIPFGIFGKNTLYLPECSLAIGEIFWRLYTPDEYQLIYLGGNIDYKSPGMGSLLNLVQTKAFFPQIPYAYAGDASKSYQYNKANLKKRFKTTEKMTWDHMDQNLRSTQVQVQIPVTGNLYRFESYLIKDFTPEITFYYINETAHKIISIVYGLLTFLLTFWVLSWIFERSWLLPSLQKRRICIYGVMCAFILVILSVLFRFGVFAWIKEGGAFAVILFAFLQNRRETMRQAPRKTIWRPRLTEIFFLFLILLVSFTWLMGFLGGAVFICVFSILVHAVLPRIRKLNVLTGNKKSAENISAIIFIFLLLMPVSQQVRAGAPGLSITGDSTQLTDDGFQDKDAKVNLAWPTMEKMLNKIEARKKAESNKLNTDFLFGTVLIEGDITEKYATLHMDIPLTLVSKEFVKVPLVSIATPVSSATYNSKPLSLNQDHSYVYFEAGKETERKGMLKLTLIAPVHEQGGVKEFQVTSPLLQGGDVKLKFGTDIKSVKLYNVSWEKREGRIIRAALGSAKQLRGELATFLRKQETADETDKRVKKRYSTTFTLVSLEDEIATFYSSIRYRILNEHVREFKIQLPADVTVHEIVGEDMEQWRIENTENGITTYRVNVMYPVAERYDLSVRYETKLSEENKEFIIPCLMVADVARDMGYIGIEMRGNSEIALSKLDKARLIDIRELPEIIRADADATFVYGLRYIERPYRIAFQIMKHKGLRLDPAIADRIHYTHVISTHGKVLSQARMWVRNSRKQYATFSLPDGAQLISSFLDDKSVKPSINKDGTLLLPLKRQSATPFVLDVVYESADVPMYAFGSRMQLPYPQLDIPISIVVSDIYVPKKMKVLAMGGHFREIKSVNFVPWTSSIQPQAGFSENNLQNWEIQYTNMKDIDQFGGTMSLKINLPKHGRLVSMNTFYIPIGERLESRISMIHDNIYYTGYLLALVILLCTGAFFKQFYRDIRFLCFTVFIVIVIYITFNFSWKSIFMWMASAAVLHYIVQKLNANRTKPEGV